MKKKKIIYIILGIIALVILINASFYVIADVSNRMNGLYADDAVDEQKEIKIVVGEGKHNTNNLKSVKHIYFLENDVVVDTLMRYEYEEGYAKEKAEKFGNFAMYDQKVVGNYYIFKTRSVNGTTLEELMKTGNRKIITNEELLDILNDK